MCVGYSMEDIKEKIDYKRGQLNEMVISDIDKGELLKYSVELDRLIDQYYFLESNKNRAK